MRQLKITKQITKRDSDSINKYLNEISQIDGPLSIEEEEALTKKIKNGDKKAENELVLRNLRFVISVAKKYQQSGIPLGDLINEGNIGLIKAARKYDFSKGYKFISYAVWWIRQSILQYLSEHGRAIRLPLNRLTQLSKIRKIKSELEQKFEREPSVSEIIESSKNILKENDVNLIIRLNHKISSLDGEAFNSKSGNDDFRLIDIIEDKNQLRPNAFTEKEDNRIEVNRLLNNISERNKFVLIHYYGLNNENEKTLEEIANMLDLTRERIRQIKNDSLLHLKAKYKNKKF